MIYKFSQSGAMFGLDARIALAIFGLLSVVAGYSAVSIFGQAGVTALSTELSNLKKAYTEFYVATGAQPAKFMDLINNESGYPGWKGPYIDGMLSDKSRLHGTYSLQDGRVDVNGVPPVECSGGGICGVWLKLTKVKDGVAKELHDKMNGGEKNLAAGILRVEITPGQTDDIYFFIANSQSGNTEMVEE
jgi:type II secretory pathway pseudopilin PulG